jgi:plastocyanin
MACGDDDDGDNGDGTPATTAASSPATTSSPGSSPTQATSPTTAASPTQSSGVTIRVEDNVFSPDARTVPAGTEVTWQWAGELPHSVEGTFNGQEVKSAQQREGTFKFTFASAGTFSYLCGVHGQAMSGTITVS